jgi:Tetratricopeptide repeat
MRGYAMEGRGWLEQGLAPNSGVSVLTRARAGYRAGALAWRQGDYRRAEALAEESVARCREVGAKLDAAFALGILGFTALLQGQPMRALDLAEQSLPPMRAGAYT